MVNLIPSSESVMQTLRKTGAYRHGHFVFPNGSHTSHYFQMPLAFRYYDNARIMAVGLSRKFRMIKAIASRLPKVSIISPSPGGIPIAFGVREALEAEQIYWAEIENGKRRFRQYMKESDIYPCIIVDDLIRSGKAMTETYNLITEYGAEVIGMGSIVKFKDAPNEIEGVKIESLAEFDCEFYDTAEQWREEEGNESDEETVRF